MRAQAFIDALAFAAPEIEALYLPSWDCQPYDRVSPNAARFGRAHDGARAARAEPRRDRAAAHSRRLGQRADPARPAARLRCLRRLLGRARQQRADGGPRALAGIERLCPREHRARRRRLCDPRRHPRSLSARRSGADPARLLRRHARIDPRLRSRDAAQRRAIALARPRADERGAADDRNDPRASARPTRPSSARPTPDDDLYAAVSEGRRAIGLEHWLPLLYEKLDTIFDYVGDAPFVLDARAEEAASQRLAQIADAYAARRAAYLAGPGKADYKPLPPRGSIWPRTNGRSGSPPRRSRG